MKEEKENIDLDNLTININNMNGEEKEGEIGLNYLKNLEKERLESSPEGEKIKKKREKKRRALLKNYKDGQLGSLIFKAVSIMIIAVCYVLIYYVFDFSKNSDGLEALVYYLFFWPLIVLPFGLGSCLVILIFAILNVIVMLVNLFRIVNIWKSSKGAKVYVILNTLLTIIFFTVLVFGVEVLLNLNK